jgi:MSHA biogenesis protein MshL
MSVGYRQRGVGIAQLGWALFATACASAPAAAPPTTSVRLEAPAASSASAAGAPNVAPTPLPALPTSAGTISDGGHEPRIQNLDVNGQELGTVVRALATSLGLQYQVDPSVSAHRVNARIRNQTLSDAMAAIVPQGVTYEISNRTLRVSPARVETRTFTLDYVALSRFGMATTVIQRRLGGSGFQGTSGGVGVGGGLAAAGAGGSNFGGGADIITAVSISDIWEDIRMSLEALVFDATRQTPVQQAVPATGMAGAGGRTTTRAEADGRRLIVNPIAGSITVSAFPASLAQVESFIRNFEASIQRQVLIEAKIVEVNLEESFEFGIDWNVVTNIVRRGTTLGINVRTPTNTPRTTGNVELTLGGGDGSVSAVLNALESQGNVRVLSNPRVSALNNQRAVFNVTTSEVIFTTSRTPILGPTGGIVSFETQVTPQQIQVGIVLDVLPQIGSDNGVTMNIRPVVTSVARTASFVQDGNTFTAPVIDTRESDTMARLRAGETIIIGGLMQTRSERVKSGVPGLRSIPLLGRAFTSYKNVERKSELVIFLTPTIISGQPPLGR